MVRAFQKAGAWTSRCTFWVLKTPTPLQTAAGLPAAAHNPIHMMQPRRSHPPTLAPELTAGSYATYYICTQVLPMNICIQRCTDSGDTNSDTERIHTTTNTKHKRWERYGCSKCSCRCTPEFWRQPARICLLTQLDQSYILLVKWTEAAVCHPRANAHPILPEVLRKLYEVVWFQWLKSSFCIICVARNYCVLFQ